MSSTWERRYLAGRYVLWTGFFYWTGRWIEPEKPDLSVDINRARLFVSARHAYAAVQTLPVFRNFRVRRVGGVSVTA